MITQEELKEVLKYNPDTGIFTWIKTSSNGLSKAGEVAGYQSHNGTNTQCIVINIKKRKIQAHQLAFLYMEGYIPDLIDHKDRNGLNNRWYNLRVSNKSLNSVNAIIQKNNTSGFKGVCNRNDPRRVKKWRSSIQKDGKQILIGSFHTKEEAAIAYDIKAIELFGEFATTNKMLGLL